MRAAALRGLAFWWGSENEDWPLPLGANVINKRFEPAIRKSFSDILTASIQSQSRSSRRGRPACPCNMRATWAGPRRINLSDVRGTIGRWIMVRKGRESIPQIFGRAFERGLIPQRQNLEFCGLTEIIQASELRSSESRDNRWPRFLSQYEMANRSWHAPEAVTEATSSGENRLLGRPRYK